MASMAAKGGGAEKASSGKGHDLDPAMFIPKDLGYSRNGSTVCTPLTAVPRYPWRDPRALELASAGKPVIFTNTKLVDVAVDKWSLRYLEKHILPTTTFTVHSAPVNGDFLYSDLEKGITEGENPLPVYSFQRHSIKEKITFKQFARRMKEAFRKPATPPYDDDLVAAPGSEAPEGLSGEELRKARENWGDDIAGGAAEIAAAEKDRKGARVGRSAAKNGAIRGQEGEEGEEGKESAGAEDDKIKTSGSAGFMQGFLPGLQDPRIRKGGSGSTGDKASSEKSVGGTGKDRSEEEKGKTPHSKDEKNKGGVSGQSYSPSRMRVYLQQPLYAGIGKQIKKDFGRFHWAWVQAMQALLPTFADLTTNMLLIGERGNITPCHYDEQQNMFAQVRGRKRIILYSPEYWSSFYTHPVGHTADRQSQVDMYRPDYERFPRLAKAKGVEAILQPGEVIYIPALWFHHIECLDTPCVSVNFWFKSAPDDPSKVKLPLEDPVRLLSMRRNVEKITMKKLGIARAARFWDTLSRWLLKRNASSRTVEKKGPEEAGGGAGGLAISGAAHSDKGSSNDEMLQYEGDFYAKPSSEDIVAFAEHEASIRQMLKAVLKPECIDEFIWEMCDSRFIYLKWGSGSGVERAVEPSGSES